MSEALARRMLETMPVVAVLGAHHEPSRPAYYVPEYLAQHGYDIWPVNQPLAGTKLFGRATVATLRDVPVAIDLVVFFRRPEHLSGHLDDLLAMSPAPKGVWLQLGIVNDAFADAVRATGIDVVQDRCTLADHRRWGLGAPA